MGEGEAEIMPEEPPKKSRHRKKHLYNTILQQMEFYFSDSNLSKDRFLSQLLAESSDVDIEVFLKFNKIRKLNCNLEDLKKAISKSELIGITEDGKKIHRKKPLKVKDNVDFCTIYVENIKADATHESLSQIFSDFGNVVYVSIPKYRHNKTNKGFAFIEYETEQQANEALSFFENIGCKISSEKSPEELQSIRTFEDESEIEDKGTKRKLDLNEEESNKKPKTEIENDNNLKKRKSSVEEKISNKKMKVENKEVKIEDVKENQVSETEDTKKKKKSKKEKRKNHIKELGMQVLSKKEWKKLRNNYLQLQRKKMKEFKQYLYKQRFGPKSYNIEEGEEFVEEKESDNIAEEVNKLSYAPGVIVKLRLPEPCSDVKKLKGEIKSVSSEVKYVDIPLPSGSEEVYIRFSSKEGASEFCTKEFGGDKTVITGDEEKNYWEKIQTDRTVKFQKMAKKQRGRDKLLKKAEKESEKHLRFDENE